MEEYSINETDQYFLDSLQKNSQIPRKKVWLEIEKALDSEDKKYFERINNRISRISFVFSICMVVVSLSWLYFHFPTKSKLFVKSAGIYLPAFKSRIIKKVSDSSQLDISSPRRIFQTKQTVTVHRVQTKKIDQSKPLGLNDELKKSNFDVLKISVARTRTSGNLIVTGISPKTFSAPVSPNATALKTESLHRLKTEFKKFALTMYASKEFAGYNLTDNDLRGANGKEIESRERTIFSASAGINLNYRMSRKWSLQSGLTYSWSKSNIDSATSYAMQGDAGNVQFKFNSVLGYSYLHSPGAGTPILGDSISTANTLTRLDYLTLPLTLTYRIAAGRFAFVPAVGVTFNVLTQAYLETDVYGQGYSENESQILIRGLKKVNVGMLVKADLEYRLSKTLTAVLIPSFKRTLSPVNLKSAFSTYPYNFGIGTGLQIVF